MKRTIQDKDGVEWFFDIIVGSPPDHEELICNINLSRKLSEEEKKKGDWKPSFNIIDLDDPNHQVFSSKGVATITQEEGPDKLKIKFGEYVTKNAMDLDKLVQTIQEAKSFLLHGS